LIVDDEPAAIQALHKALEGIGEVRYATGGLDALALLAEYPVDLILLDANMPEMDGFATCHAMQRDYSDIPVIFVTAASEIGNEIRALEAGAIDFISKPISPPVVRARVSVHLKLKSQNDLLRSLSSCDPLTGVANRRALDDRITQECRRAARNHQPLSLLMIEIDHYKTYSHCYGHHQADDCLRQVAQTLAATLSRADDLVARYGGEVFAVLLTDTAVQAAATLADQMCAAVRAQAIPLSRSGTTAHVTLSIGVASILPLLPPPGQRAVANSLPAADVESRLAGELFELANRALYAAKMAGRDRVCVNETKVS
jgi:diguanylate cyclase (GGDEF)-like protein